MLANYFGSVRFVYNHFLAKRKEQYEQTRKSSNYYEQAKELTAMKKTEAFSWLKATEYSSRNSKGVSGSPRVRMFWAS